MLEAVGMDGLPPGPNEKGMLGELGRKSWKRHVSKQEMINFPGGPMAKPQAPKAGGLGSIPGQER